MDTNHKPEISHDDYLKVLALATMANEYYAKATEFAAAAQEIVLATPEQYPGNKLDDAIYTDTRSKPADFADALRIMGVTILPAEGNDGAA